MAKAKPTVAGLAAHIERELDAEAAQRTKAIEAVRSRLMVLHMDNAEAIGKVDGALNSERIVRRAEDADLHEAVATLSVRVTEDDAKVLNAVEELRTATFRNVNHAIVRIQALEKAEAAQRDRSVSFGSRLRWLLTGQ